MELMRVLVVEDNWVVADAVAEGLRDQGMAVDVAYDGPTGQDKATVNAYDVIVLDRDLPRLHGDVLCQQTVVSPSTSRILMLTAAAAVEDRVEGLNLGADDYLAKPFDFSELVARVRALARPSPSAPPVLARGDLIIARAVGGLVRCTADASVAATYAVVAPTSAPAPAHNSIPAGLARTCKTAEANGTLKPDPALATQCQYFLGAANQRTSDLHELLVWSLGGLGVATIMAGALGWAIGRRILLPLHKVTAAARRASQDRLDERISLDGPDDELKELADTFDDMLTPLDLAFASQRRFVANASHELRTPLTSMATLIDVAMSKPTRTTEQLEVLAGRVRQAVAQSEA